MLNSGGDSPRSAQSGFTVHEGPEPNALRAAAGFGPVATGTRSPQGRLCFTYASVLAEPSERSEEHAVLNLDQVPFALRTVAE